MMALLTTIVGPYPKPDYILAPDPSRSKRPGPPARAGTPRQSGPPLGDEFQQLLDRASRDVVLDQVNAGIEVPATGAVRRDHYIYDLCRRLEGLDFSRQTGKAVRQLASKEAEVPSVTGPIRRREQFLLPEWRVAQSATRRPVKINLPGPLAIADWLADAYYGDEKQLAADLAEALNGEIRALAEAGCAWIQLDEPLFALEPDKAVAFGIDNLEHCFHRLPPPVVRIAHLSNGYPAEPDSDEYPKAGPDAYFELAEALEVSAIQAVSIEDTHQPLDLALLERFTGSRVILSVIAGARSRVEPVEEITARLSQALEHIDPERLMVAADGNLALLDRRLVQAKLTHLVIAARAVG